MISLTAIGLVLTLMLSPAIESLFPTTSQSIGLCIAAAFWIAAALVAGPRAYAIPRSDARFAATACAAILALVLHATVSQALIGGVDFNRLFVSSAILLAVLLGVRSAGRKIRTIPPQRLVTLTGAILSMLGIMGLGAAAGVPGIGGFYGNSVIIFSEPSHFALAYLPLLLFRMSVASRTTQLVLIVLSLLIAALLQSLTMIAGLLIVTVILLRSRLLLLVLIPAAAAATVLDISYYAERLYLSPDSDNLSTLVFLQGWENALQDLIATRGLGVGYQQFGIAGSTGEITEKITQIMNGAALNLLDGGTTASKLIGEFGVVGIVIVAYLARSAFKGLLFIRAAQKLPALQRNVHQLFFHSMITAYLSELFIRGVGYFSAGGFLALVGLISLPRLRAARLRAQDPPARQARLTNSTANDATSPVNAPTSAHTSGNGDDLCSGGNAGSMTFNA